MALIGLARRTTLDIDLPQNAANFAAFLKGCFTKISLSDSYGVLTL
jgi:hypothetical protein